tara:strand:+ start:18566 stop:19981 length:1416 start_codon:yes stop_codon:yes gene_type:complete
MAKQSARESATDGRFNLRLIRDGQLETNSSGASDLADFVVTCNVIQSINGAGIQAEINIMDSANLINSLVGDEIWQLIYTTQQGTISYPLQSYSIENRSRQNNTDLYTVKCCSPEFLANEVSNLFGSSKVVFNKEDKSHDIVERILRGKESGTSKFMKTKKKCFIEPGDNSHEFILCNWRWFDTIYWVAQRSVRKQSGKSKDPQNGFLFFENGMGYNFVSIDKMIADINKQEYDSETDTTSGEAKLYQYVYSPKKAGQEAADLYKINTVKYVSDRNILEGLRNGTWAGHSSALDPTVLSNSLVSVESENTSSTYTYSVDELWSKMEHLDGKSAKHDPYGKFSDQTVGLMKTPRRIRHTFLPNRVADGQDATAAENDNKLYEQLPYLQSYQFARVQTLKTIQLLVTVPGNTDLYAGKGIDIVIPMNKVKGEKPMTDTKYSGRYLIAAVRHKWDGREMYTEMLVYRDTLRGKK